jgi:hypothetical protein
VCGCHLFGGLKVFCLSYFMMFCAVVWKFLIYDFGEDRVVKWFNGGFGYFHALLLVMSGSLRSSCL